jgi:hypothetical protein
MPGLLLVHMPLLSLLFILLGLVLRHALSADTAKMGFFTGAPSLLGGSFCWGTVVGARQLILALRPFSTHSFYYICSACFVCASPGVQPPFIFMVDVFSECSVFDCVFWSRMWCYPLVEWRPVAVSIISDAGAAVAPA